jgi:hypothetical protein
MDTLGERERERERERDDQRRKKEVLVGREREREGERERECQVIGECRRFEPVDNGATPSPSLPLSLFHLSLPLSLSLPHVPLFLCAKIT